MIYANKFYRKLKILAEILLDYEIAANAYSRELSNSNNRNNRLCVILELLNPYRKAVTVFYVCIYIYIFNR